MSTEPLSHLMRRCPPWREPDTTECGRAASDVARVISRDDARALIGKHGKQRAAFLLCMTCAGTSDRYRDWAKSPTDVVGREGSSAWRPEITRMDRELFAIAALVEAHRGEFDDYLNGLDETASLDAQRTARAARTRQTGGRSL